MRNAYRHLPRILLAATAAMILFSLWLFRPPIAQWYAEYKLRQKLQAPVTLSLVAIPFADVQVVFRDIVGVKIELDGPVRERVHIDTPVTVTIGHRPAAAAIESIAAQLGGSYIIRGDTVYITTGG